MPGRSLVGAGEKSNRDPSHVRVPQGGERNSGRRRLAGKRLQILLDRIIPDGHVNQRSVLQSADELVVVDRIKGDAADDSAPLASIKTRTPRCKSFSLVKVRSIIRLS